jgi:hypothetical protein
LSDAYSADAARDSRWETPDGGCKAAASKIGASISLGYRP